MLAADRDGAPGHLPTGDVRHVCSRCAACHAGSRKKHTRARIHEHAASTQCGRDSCDLAAPRPQSHKYAHDRNYGVNCSCVRRPPRFWWHSKTPPRQLYSGRGKVPTEVCRCLHCATLCPHDATTANATAEATEGVTAAAAVAAANAAVAGGGRRAAGGGRRASGAGSDRAGEERHEGRAGGLISLALGGKAGASKGGAGGSGKGGKGGGGKSRRQGSR